MDSTCGRYRIRTGTKEPEGRRAARTIPRVTPGPKMGTAVLARISESPGTGEIPGLSITLWRPLRERLLVAGVGFEPTTFGL